MSDTSTTAYTEHRRKRVRKGTKSCWECKRRKIRCDFLDSEAVCAGCLDRGTKCISQEFVDEQAPPSGTQLGQRMGRVEMLLERLMQKVDSNGVGSERDHGLVVLPEPRESLGIDVLTPSSSTSNQYENAPILSLFDNAVFGREMGSGSGAGRHNSAVYASPVATSTQGNSPLTQTQSKLERLRRTLAVMLPSQHDLDTLTDESHGWWLIRRHLLPDTQMFLDHDFSKPFSVQEVSQGHPIVIARLLLAVSLCIQQLPHDFDQTKLNFVGSMRDRMEKNLATASTITSDDELIGSLEGIECLILQGGYHVNAGNIRRAWLCFRRAISVAQLIGLHRPSRNLGDVDHPQGSRKEYLWFQLVKADRFLSLILGVPSSGAVQFPFDDSANWLTVEDRYAKHLCEIAGLIVDRNQAEPTHAFSTTQNIDEKLDDLVRQMPNSWWELPKTSAFGRTDEAAVLFDRLLVQIWHYELESLVHLPFMLRAALDRRYEYSRLSCLSASREMIRRWIFLRECSKAPFVCRIVEFQAFKAAVTLLLGVLQPSQVDKDAGQFRQEEADRKLVNEVTQIFEEMQMLGVDVVLAQSIEVLQTLLAINLNDGSKGNIRLTIPHFGTISVARGSCKLRPGCKGPLPESHPDATGFHLDPSLQPWQEVPVAPFPPYPTPPLLTFTSTQFPPLTAEMGDWQFKDSDTVLFDSLLNSDLEGNWNF